VIPDEGSRYMGGIDILVTCAGDYKAYRIFEDITESEWDFTVELKLKSVLLCCKYAISFMKERRWGKQRLDAESPIEFLLRFSIVQAVLLGAG
jgi:NAD(P)-dependent dehydrogenase (short-subunit alcohol dehydrogenase family)